LRWHSSKKNGKAEEESDTQSTGFEPAPTTLTT
jgi:hypothetical protein